MGIVRFIPATPIKVDNVIIELEGVEVSAPPLIRLNILNNNQRMIDNIHKKLARRQECKKNGRYY